MAALLPAVIALQDLPGRAVPVRAALERAADAIDTIGFCARRRSPREAFRRAHRLSADLTATGFRATQLFGGAADHDDGRIPGKPQRCTPRSVGAAQRAGADALAQARRSLDAIEAPLRQGLWLGLFPACADTVASAEIVQDDPGRPAVSLRFTPPYDAALARYSRAFRNRQGRGFRIAVRLNGAIVSRPVMYAPLSTIALTGPPAATLAMIAARAHAACAGGPAR